MAIDITLELVRNLVDTQFPQWSKFEIKPVEFQGWDNRTFHLGESMVVRLPSAERYIPQAEKEQRWLPILAKQLPLTIPTLLARGTPDDMFPWKWGVYNWIEGETANITSIRDLHEFARALANFLRILQKINTTDAPLAGPHCFYRGASLLVYDEETRETIIKLNNKINADLALEIWEDALATKWDSSPVWFHGDVSSGNLIVKNGRLHAVIDFGSCGVGDPSCDFTIAWTLLTGDSRKLFRTKLNVDDGTWSRARGWALWKALITIQESIDTNNAAKEKKARNTLNEIFTDYVEAKISNHKN